MSSKIADLLKSEVSDKEIIVRGWIRTSRDNKNVVFINLNDGSTIKNIQIVADPAEFDKDLISKFCTGACLEVHGKLVQSAGSGQAVEVQASKIIILGEADPNKYPIQPKRHSLEFLREQAHLRFRTNTFSAVFRIRHTLTFAIHKYFNDKGFFNIHTPIITGSDAEGAGEMFRVTTLDLKNPPLNDENEIDFKQDFFAKETNLTVSGQLEAELGAMALGQVYTFGPTFRAENSNTSRHASEFWMIEPEVAFNDINDNQDLAEDFLKSVIKYAMDNCADDIEFLQNRELDEEKNMKKEDRHEMKLTERLDFVIDQPFVRITYTEAIRILHDSKPYKKKKFQFPVEWGVDLASEHERYLVEKKFKCPVIVCDYPAKIKAFYMRLNDDNKTVAAMDILFPGIGEIVGGSQREERLENLENKFKEFNIPEDELSWYLDTRRYGTAVHSGFGLGFERLIMFVTGMSNIRDVIPFPRTPQNAHF
ncbi:MAG: asparagine--tRNA ligase [Flavobacteriales bacterium]|nr:asparagine--tRNA ligase [Flavobacteriales bacterium]